jgi:hypothetical protein
MPKTNPADHNHKVYGDKPGQGSRTYFEGLDAGCPTCLRYQAEGAAKVPADPFAGLGSSAG